MPNATSRLITAGSLVLLASTLGPPARAIAEERGADVQQRRLVLQVSSRVSVPSAVLKFAQQQVFVLFEKAGVAVDWIGCGIDRLGIDRVGIDRVGIDRVDGAPARKQAEFVVPVAVVSSRNRALRFIPERVLGGIIIGESGEAAWVFFDRVERAADRRGNDVSLLLGHAIAHEAAHLLLPRGTHAGGGLMGAKWTPDDLERVGHGALRFSESEAVRMRAALGGGPSMAATAGPSSVPLSRPLASRATP